MKNFIELFIKILVPVCSLFGREAIQAAEYAYHPSSPMHLGGGFNPYKPTEAYLECVDHDGLKPLDTPANRELTITIDTVKSRHDLYSKTEMSAAVSGSYGPFSGSGSINKLDEISFNENDFNWIIVLKSDMGKYGLKNPRPNVELKQLSLTDAYDRCGSEIVVQERRGVMLYAFVSVHNLSHSERHELESVINGGFNNYIYSMETSAKYQSILKFSYAVGTVSIRVHAQGGAGLTELADIVGGGENNFANYERLPDLVNKYVKSFNPKTAVPLQYFTTSLKSFKANLPPRYADFRSAQVGQLYEKYLDALKAVQRIDALLSPNANSDVNISEAERTSLEGSRRRYQYNLDKLYTAGKSCFDEKAALCSLPKLSDFKIHWPKENVERMCEKKRIDALNKRYYPHDYYEIAARRNLVPIIGHTQGKIGIIGYGDCTKEYL